MLLLVLSMRLGDVSGRNPSVMCRCCASRTRALHSTAAVVFLAVYVQEPRRPHRRNRRCRHGVRGKCGERRRGVRFDLALLMRYDLAFHADVIWRHLAFNDFKLHEM